MYDIIKGFFDGLKPTPRITVTEWSDKFRYLAPTSSSESGLYKSSRTPYLKEIMDKLSANDPTQEIVFIKGAQVGATEAGFNWLGYIIDIAPGPTLIVAPTESMSKRNSKMRLDPMIEATPTLRDKIAPARSRDSGNTTLQKDFPGGVVVMTGANSAVGLRSMPVANLFLDEVDGYPIDLDGEGSPLDLAKARTRTYPRRKIFVVSTPTVEGMSVIEKEYQDSDQRRFFVPCPHCGHKQFLKFENLRWDEGNTSSALYFCEECAAGIEERHKPYMLSNGEWRATNLEYKNTLKCGYHINSLYSPFGWYSWSESAADWEKAEGNVTKQKAFINTVLGETYKEKGEAPPWENLYNRRIDYKINKPNNDIGFITIGVDIQRDRIELEIVGWCKRKISYSIDFRVLVGDTSSNEVWDKLAGVVTETWTREDGLELNCSMMAIDTGYNTQFVYDFCKRFDITRVVPVKGMDKLDMIVSPPRQVEVTKAGKKVGRVKVWHVGVGHLKSEIYGYLKSEIAEDGYVPTGYCFFPQYDQHFFRGLTAEQLEIRVNNKGYREYQWVKKYERNEPLDCRVYARAAASVVGLDRHGDNDIWWQNLLPAKTSNISNAKKQRKNRTDFW